MALLVKNNFNPIAKNRNTVHDVASATYTSFDYDGKRLFQIDTYGKSDRQIPGKISQSIQIDKEMAKEIVQLLKKTFSI